MSHETTLPLTEARRTIFTLASNVQKPGRYYTLTDNGRAKAVIMSAQEFESWVETLEVMRDFPTIAKDAAEARRDFKSGKWKKYTSLESILEKEGLISNKVPKRTYGVSRPAQTKRRKSISKNR